MGAVTRGDQRAPLEGGGFALARDLHGQYGRRAVQALLGGVFLGQSRRINSSNMPALQKASGGNWAKFAERARKALDAVELDLSMVSGKDVPDEQVVNRFLNRMLMMPVALQAELFEAFSAVVAALQREDREEGIKVDEGLQSLNQQLRARAIEEISQEPLQGGQCSYTQFRIDRGLSWDEAHARSERKDLAPPEGFYESLGKSSEPVLVLQHRGQGTGQGRRARYKLHWPHTSSTQLEGVPVTERLLLRRGVRSSGEAPELEALAQRWKEVFTRSLSCTCSGLPRSSASETCAYCLRFTTRLLLTGEGLLHSWDEVQQVLGPSVLLRVRTSLGQSFVGTYVPPDDKARLRETLVSVAVAAAKEELANKGVMDGGLCESSSENGDDDKGDNVDRIVELLSSGDEDQRQQPSKRPRFEKTSKGAVTGAKRGVP